MSTRKFLSEEQKDAILKMYNEGYGSDTIGVKFGIHANSALRIVKQRGGTSRGVLKSSISEEEQLKFVKMYQEGMSTIEIAKTTTVTSHIISKYLKRHGVQIRDDEECRRKFPIRKDFFDVIDTQEKAYFLGFLYADGCNMKHVNSVRVVLATPDRDILEKLVKIIYINEPKDRIKDYVCQRKAWTKDKGDHMRTCHESYFTINSKYICQKLSDLGCEPRKSLTLQFPKWLTDPDLQRHFIRGFYDGDGGVHLSNVKSRGAHLKIVSTKSFAEDMIAIIKKQTGITFGAPNDFRKDGKIYSTSIAGNRQTAHFLDWLYYGATIWLDRKYNLYQKLLNKNIETDQLIAAGTQGYSWASYEKYKKQSNWDGSFEPWMNEISSDLENDILNEELEEDEIVIFDKKD